MDSTPENYLPRLVVPDTNILVDRLESMKELANSGDWSIRVPIMVVIELEHLAEVQGCGQVLDCGGGGPVQGFGAL